MHQWCCTLKWFNRQIKKEDQRTEHLPKRTVSTQGDSFPLTKNKSFYQANNKTTRSHQRYLHKEAVGRFYNLAVVTLGQCGNVFCPSSCIFHGSLGTLCQVINHSNIIRVMQHNLWGLAMSSVGVTIAFFCPNTTLQLQKPQQECQVTCVFQAVKQSNMAF